LKLLFDFPNKILKQIPVTFNKLKSSNIKLVRKTYFDIFVLAIVIAQLNDMA